MSALAAEYRRVQEAYAALERQWETTAGLWSDDAQHRFEAEVWQEYKPRIRNFGQQLNRLAELIAQARRETS